MSKQDLKLIGIILTIALIMLICLNSIPKMKNGIAKVYYDNQLIQTIDLNIDQTNIIQGEKGDIKIEVQNNQIRVVSETSEKHLCSKQGWIKNTTQSIVCLPNKVVIKIENNSEADKDLDTIVK